MILFVPSVFGPREACCVDSRLLVSGTGHDL